MPFTAARPRMSSSATHATPTTTASDANRSMARTPRDCTDTDDNASDFGPQVPATPQSSMSPPVIY